MTEWSLIYFLIYAYLNILAQSQILVISLYAVFWLSFWEESCVIPVSKEVGGKQHDLLYST